MARKIIIAFVLLIPALIFVNLPSREGGGWPGNVARAAEEGLLEELKDVAVNTALDGLKDTVVAKYMAGIGTVEQIAWHGDSLSLRVRLEGISEPIDVDCADIMIAPDGSTVTVNRFSSNMKFAQTALQRFAQGKAFPVPRGEARTAVLAAKKVLGI